jgi:hypothetical protein
MSQTDAPLTPLAELRPSPPRRVFGVAVLGLLGLVLLYTAFRFPADGLGWTLFLLGFGALVLWLSVRLWQATETGLVLTRVDLRDGKGRLLTTVEQITAIDRGVFAVKPAGGFTIVTKDKGPRAWAPGLWWRAGRRIGVGGVTHRHEGRYMAEVLADMLAARDKR